MITDGENKSAGGSGSSGGSHTNVPANNSSGGEVARNVLYGKIENYVEGECFQSYKELAEEFFLINNITGNLKRSYLLTSLGNSVYEKLRTLVQPARPTECDLTHIWSVLERHYAPKAHTLAERYL